MKKYLLSIAVVAIFVFYSFTQRQSNNNSGEALTSPTAPPVAIGNSTQPIIQTSGGRYKDGQYTGNTTDAFYGNIQVAAVVQGGRLSNIRILQYPNDRPTSREINSQALPMLMSEAISAQNANVDIISGATQTSQAFRESLQSALNQSKI